MNTRPGGSPTGIVSCSGGCRSKVKAPADVVSGEGPLPGSQVAMSSRVCGGHTHTLSLQQGWVAESTAKKENEYTLSQFHELHAHEVLSTVLHTASNMRAEQIKILSGPQV